MKGTLLTRDLHLTTNTLADGLLSTANDVGIVDVSDMTRISLVVNQVVDSTASDTVATLDLATKTTHVNTVVETVATGAAADLVTLAFTAGSGVNAGTLDESAYPAIVFNYKTGVTTVTNFETAIAASVHLAVLTPGTGANIFASPADTFTATAFAGGAEGLFSLLVEKTHDGTNYATVATVTQANLPNGTNKAYIVALSDANGMPLPARRLRVTLATLGEASKFTAVAAGIER